MQSLLSSIHHSLSHSRSPFTLRVFVSYDALGRRKESVVVDIEPPRPPPLYTPRYTIRVLTPASPLHAASLHTAPSTAPVNPTLTSTAILTSTLPSQSVHTALPITATSTSGPSIAPTSLFPVCSPIALATPSPSTLPQSSWLPPTLCPLPSSAPFFNFAGSLLSQSSSPPPPTAITTTLSLSPRGIEDAVDDEMGNGGDSGGSGSGSGPVSGPTSGPVDPVGPSGSTDGSTVETTATADLDEVKRAKEKQKRKARKARWKERQRERAAQMADESKEENEDEDGTEPDLDRDGWCWQFVAAELVIPGEVKDEYARALADIVKSGGAVSIGTYRKLTRLLDWEMEEVARCNRTDWMRSYETGKRVALKVVISDADLDGNVSDYSDGDHMVDQ